MPKSLFFKYDNILEKKFALNLKFRKKNIYIDINLLFCGIK